MLQAAYPTFWIFRRLNKEVEDEVDYGIIGDEGDDAHLSLAPGADSWFDSPDYMVLCLPVPGKDQSILGEHHFFFEDYPYVLFVIRFKPLFSKPSGRAKRDTRWRTGAPRQGPQ